MKKNFISRIRDLLERKPLDPLDNERLPENKEIDDQWDTYLEKINNQGVSLTDKQQNFLHSLVIENRIDLLDTAINNGVDINLLDSKYPYFQLEKIVHYAAEGKDISFLTERTFHTPDEMILQEQKHDIIMKRESVYKEINTIAGEKNAAISKKDIGIALSSTIKHHSNLPLRDLLEKFEEAEKQFYFKYNPLSEFENAEDADGSFYLHRGALKATEELTGLSPSDIESNYVYETNKGYFEGNYDMIDYYEKIAFGDWHTQQFVGHTEVGDYVLDKSSPEYLAYKERQIDLTIDKICEKYPEDIYSGMISSNPEYLKDFLETLENTYTPQHKISMDRAAVDRLASRTPRQPSPKNHFEL